jgi:hypothetical protein
MDNMETQPLDLSEIPALDEEDLWLDFHFRYPCLV